MSREQLVSRREWVLSALDQYEGRLTRYAERLMGGDRDQARDVVQHAFLRLCDEAREVLRDHVGQWLFTVCHHRAVDLVRKQKRLEPFTNGDGAVCAGREPDPAATLETKDAYEHVRRLVATLQTKQQEAVNLWAEGFSYRQISQITGRSEGYVRVLVHRAFQEIRRQLKILEVRE